MSKFELKAIARSRTFLPLLMALMLILSSLGFLVKDSIIFNGLKEKIAPEIELGIEDFRSDSEDRFHRFKKSLKTDWEREGWDNSHNWAKPAKRTLFSMQIDRLGPINESENTIFISGRIKARWSQASFSSLRKNKDESDIFPKDILKDSKLNSLLQKCANSGLESDLFFPKVLLQIIL